jgi:acyl-CoA thioesterase FadM
LEIRTRIVQLEGVRIGFQYKTYNEDGLLLNEAYTLLVFVSATTQKPIPAPPAFLNLITN